MGSWKAQEGLCNGLAARLHLLSAGALLGFLRSELGFHLGEPLGLLQSCVTEASMGGAHGGSWSIPDLVATGGLAEGLQAQTRMLILTGGSPHPPTQAINSILTVLSWRQQQILQALTPRQMPVLSPGVTAPPTGSGRRLVL